VTLTAPISAANVAGIPTPTHKALNDVEISGVQVCPQNAARRDWILTIEGNRRVPVIQCSGKGRLGVRENRSARLESVRQLMEIRHGSAADAGEIEHEVIACCGATEILGLAGGEDRVAGTVAVIMYDWGHRFLAGARRIVNDSTAGAAHTTDRTPIVNEFQRADSAREMNHRSVCSVGYRQNVGGRIEQLAETRGVAIDIRKINLVGMGLRSIGGTETGNQGVEVFGLVELQCPRRAAKRYGLTG
jgi:hypothetical protein